MRIGITGASGLVGRALTKLAVAEGHEVVAFSRSPESKIDAACETRDFQVPDNARVDDLDAMVHLAGEPILGWWSQSKRDRIRESRVSGTAGVVEAIRRCAENRRPEVLVCASGSGYYGDRGDEVLDEDADSGFGFLARVCREWEAAASRVNDHGVRWVSARTGMVLGREGGAAPLLEKLFKFCLGGRLGSGDQWVPWVGLEDTARMYLHCVENQSIRGPVNFVAPHPVTNAEFTRVISEQVNRPAVVPAPAPLLRLVLRDMSDMLLFSQRLDPQQLRLQKFEWLAPDLDVAIRRAMAGTEKK